MNFPITELSRSTSTTKTEVDLLTIERIPDVIHGAFALCNQFHGGDDLADHVPQEELGCECHDDTVPVLLQCDGLQIDICGFVIDLAEPYEIMSSKEKFGTFFREFEIHPSRSPWMSTRSH